jgi:hypothetical protein
MGDVERMENEASVSAFFLQSTFKNNFPVVGGDYFS